MSDTFKELDDPIHDSDDTTDEQPISDAETTGAEEDGNVDYEAQYDNLSVWKKIVLAALFMGALIAVIMLSDFIIEISVALLKALFG